MLLAQPDNASIVEDNLAQAIPTLCRAEGLSILHQTVVSGANSLGRLGRSILMALNSHSLFVLFDAPSISECTPVRR